jgi:5-oxoprolinase (ATP-hydrolysing) subunit A
MKTIDLNCDLGEGIANEKAIMPFISSANIACGYHAGDENTIWQTAELCLQHNVAIGAHPSYLDKANFGRTEMELDADDIYDLVTQQLIIIDEIISEFNTGLHHVKPHGALYNLSAKDKTIAKAIARAVKDYNKELILFGLSGSYSIKEAERIGLKACNEVFADRNYSDDGSLVPRTNKEASIDTVDAAVKQALQFVNEGKIFSVTGKKIKIKADTICLHGDGPHALEFAQAIHTAFKKEGITVSAIRHASFTAHS